MTKAKSPPPATFTMPAAALPVLLTGAAEPVPDGELVLVPDGESFLSLPLLLEPPPLLLLLESPVLDPLPAPGVVVAGVPVVGLK